MSRIRVIWSTLALAAVLFVLGYLAHPALLRTVARGARIVYSSWDGPLIQALWTACSFALLGIAIGTGALLRGFFAVPQRYRASTAILSFVGLIAGAGWTLVLARWIAMVLANMDDLPVVPALRAADIPVYEIGLVASACVLAAAVLSILWQLAANEGAKR